MEAIVENELYLHQKMRQHKNRTRSQSREAEEQPRSLSREAAPIERRVNFQEEQVPEESDMNSVAP